MKKIETFKEFLMEKEDRETEYFFYPNGVYISTKLSEITEDKIREYQEKYLKGQEINEDIHCTLIYSKTPHPEEIIPDEYVAVGTFKEFNLFGPESNTLVMEIDSPDLEKRNKILTDKYDFISDYNEYKSHITLSYNSTLDINALPPFDFGLEFVDESVEQLEVDWVSKKDKDDGQSDTLVGKALDKQANKPNKKDQKDEKPTRED